MTDATAHSMDADKTVAMDLKEVGRFPIIYCAKLIHVSSLTDKSLWCSRSWKTLLTLKKLRRVEYDPRVVVFVVSFLFYLRGAQNFLTLL